VNTRLTLFSVLALVASAATVQAQQPQAPKDMLGAMDPTATSKNKTVFVKYSLLMPSDKTSERVKETERNPFGQAEEEHKDNFKASNEENLVRDQLMKLRVVGVIPDVKGTRVMLGDMVLSQGQVVPTVIPEQTLMLRVSKVTSQVIEFEWMEKKPTGLPARTFPIPVDVRPKVRYQLAGSAKAPAAKAADEASKRMGETGEIYLADPVASASAAPKQQADPKIADSLPAVAEANLEPKGAVKEDVAKADVTAPIKQAMAYFGQLMAPAAKEKK